MTQQQISNLSDEELRQHFHKKNKLKYLHAVMLFITTCLVVYGILNKSSLFVPVFGVILSIMPAQRMYVIHKLEKEMDRRKLR